MDFLQALGALADLLQGIIAIGGLIQRLSSPDASKFERVVIASLLTLGVVLCVVLAYMAFVQRPQQYPDAFIAPQKTQTQAFSGELGRVRTAVLKHLADWEVTARKDREIHHLAPIEADLAAEPGIKAIDFGYCNWDSGTFFVYVWRNFNAAEHPGADMVGYAYNYGTFCPSDARAELREDYLGDSWSSVEFEISPPTRTPPATAAF